MKASPSTLVHKMLHVEGISYHNTYALLKARIVRSNRYITVRLETPELIADVSKLEPPCFAIFVFNFRTVCDNYITGEYHLQEILGGEQLCDSGNGGQKTTTTDEPNF